MANFRYESLNYQNNSSLANLTIESIFFILNSNKIVTFYIVRFSILSVLIKSPFWDTFMTISINLTIL